MTTYHDYRSVVYGKPADWEIELLQQWQADEAEAERQALKAATLLGEIMGIEARNAWIDTLPENLTWSAYLDYLQAQILDYKCHCFLPEQSCPVCVTASRSHYFEDDIPCWIGDLK